MAPDRITMLAPAKVNLFIAVGARRPDGYHELTTVFQALDEQVADTLVMRRADSLDVRCHPDIGVPSESNLVTRALTELAREAGVLPHLVVEIAKEIPAAGGLGGGSSDAAAALVGACSLWGLDPASPEVAAIARGLGADVSFFLTGGTALFVGRGDMLERRFPPPDIHLVVANPGVAAPTAAVYDAFDNAERTPAPPLPVLLDALATGDVPSVVRGLHNDLAGAALAVTPAIAPLLASMDATNGVERVLVSGSGSTVFGVCVTAGGAEYVASELSRQGWWARATAPSDRGVRAIR